MSEMEFSNLYLSFLKIHNRKTDSIYILEATIKTWSHLFIKFPKILPIKKPTFLVRIIFSDKQFYVKWLFFDNFISFYSS